MKANMFMMWIHVIVIWMITCNLSDRPVPCGSGGGSKPHPEDVHSERQCGQHLPTPGGQQRGLVLPPGGGGVRSPE